MGKDVVGRVAKAAKAAKAAKVAMLDAQDVLRQVKRGRVPPFWRMYRWRRRGDVRRLALSAVYFGLLMLLGLEAGCIIIGSDPQTLGTIRQRLAAAPTAVIVCCVLAGLAVAVLALAPVAVGTQAFLSLLLPHALRPVLVMLPEGCVERTGALVRRVRVVAYADIGQIELSVRHHRPLCFDRAAHRLTFAERARPFR